jgi:hypothetical protein
LEFYKLFEDHYGGGTAVLIRGARIHRVLVGLQNPDFFSVGLKNTIQNSNTESYQIKAGPSAQNAISPSEGLLYQRGHLFGRGVTENGEAVTIGYSSSSKFWRNRSARVGELIEWCHQLTQKLLTRGTVLTGTPLDTLEVGEEIERLPNGLIGVGWPANVFKDFPTIEITTGDRKIESAIFNVESFIWNGPNNSGVVFYDSAKEMKEAWENTWSHKASVEQGTCEVLGVT